MRRLRRVACTAAWLAALDPHATRDDTHLPDATLLQACL